MRKNYSKNFIKKKNFGLIASNSLRTRIFLKYFLKEKIIPQQIFIFSKKKFVLNKNIYKNSKIIIVKTDDINNLRLINKILESDLEYFIYSGYAGKIIKSKKLLIKKKLFHCHPGKLPEFKGSTIPFYQYLTKGYLTYTLFRMSSKIDSGKIFLERKFLPPSNFFEKYDNIDSIYRIE